MGSALSGRHQLNIDLAKVTELASMGLTQAQVATGLRIGQRTLSRRLADDENFIAAYEQGAAKLAVEMANVLLDAARQGDTDAAKFILDRKCGWSKNIKKDVTIDASPTLKIILQSSIEGEIFEQICE